MIRTLLSPGVEITEVDKSQYVPTTIDTYRALLTGFSAKGIYESPTEITSLYEYESEFGTPSNEAERYSYNGVAQLLGAGATVVFTRIPYSAGPGYAYVKYNIATTDETSGDDGLGTDSSFSELDSSFSELDSSFSELESDLSDLGISAIFEVGTDSSAPSSLPEDQYYKLLQNDQTAISSIGDNSFYIVDITGKAYKRIDSKGVSSDCLGIMPVVTSAVNKMAVSGMLSNFDLIDFPTSDTIGKVNLVEALGKSDEALYLNSVDSSVTSAQIDQVWNIPTNTQISGNTFDSISKQAAKLFPTISFASNYDQNSVHTDKSYLKYIGVVVYALTVDKSTGGIVAVPVESFAGSIDPSAVDQTTGATAYIGTIINSNSKYIKFFSNGSTPTAATSDGVLFIGKQPAISLGVPPATLSKKIKVEDITSTLTKVFHDQSNVLSTIVDAVVDGGLSSIAQYVTTKDETTGEYEYDPVKDPDEQLTTAKGAAAWRTVVNKLKNFCESTRKDCVFITDSPRNYSLIGDQKIVSPLTKNNSVEKNILPNQKYISGVNTSYGWGYQIWFLIGDEHSGRAFWCPPSIFGAARYLDTRRRFSVWNAPGGLTYGGINVLDTSFEPGQTARDLIYSNGWNYSLTYTNRGVALEGVKTFQTKTSAFDRINVRSLFLHLERLVLNTAWNYIYEPNTPYTRQQFLDNLTPRFDAIKSAGGMIDYKIYIDAPINTPETYDNNEFRVRIGVKPTKLIEFIMVEFVAVRTGATWDEIEK